MINSTTEPGFGCMRGNPPGGYHRENRVERASDTPPVSKNRRSGRARTGICLSYYVGEAGVTSYCSHGRPRVGIHMWKHPSTPPSVSRHRKLAESACHWTTTFPCICSWLWAATLFLSRGSGPLPATAPVRALRGFPRITGCCGMRRHKTPHQRALARSCERL